MSDFWERRRDERRDREEERSVSRLVYDSESVESAAVDCSIVYIHCQEQHVSNR